MKALRTCLVALLVPVLTAGTPQTARAAAPPQAVAQRAQHLTRYLAQALELSKAQQKAVARSTRHYLQQLQAVPTTPDRSAVVAASSAERLLSPSSVAGLEEEYTLALARILTPGQYNAYSWLRTQQLETAR